MPSVLPIALKLTEGQAHDGRSASDMLGSLFERATSCWSTAPTITTLGAKLSPNAAAWANIKPDAATAQRSSLQRIPLSLPQPRRAVLRQAQTLQGGCNPLQTISAENYLGIPHPGACFRVARCLNESQPNVAEFTVSELSSALKRTVEDAYGYVRVRGEVSGYKGPHASGHVLFRAQGRERQDRRGDLEGRVRPHADQARGRPGGHRHRQAHHLSQPLELPDRRRDAGARRASAR